MYWFVLLFNYFRNMKHIGSFCNIKKQKLFSHLKAKLNLNFQTIQLIYYHCILIEFYCRLMYIIRYVFVFKIHAYSFKDMHKFAPKIKYGVSMNYWFGG